MVSPVGMVGFKLADRSELGQLANLKKNRQKIFSIDGDVTFRTRRQIRKIKDVLDFQLRFGMVWAKKCDQNK